MTTATSQPGIRETSNTLLCDPPPVQVRDGVSFCPFTPRYHRLDPALVAEALPRIYAHPHPHDKRLCVEAYVEWQDDGSEHGLLAATTCAVRLKERYRRTRLSDCNWRITDEEEEGIERRVLLNV